MISYKVNITRVFEFANMDTNSPESLPVEGFPLGREPLQLLVRETWQNVQLPIVARDPVDTDAELIMMAGVTSLS